MKIYLRPVTEKDGTLIVKWRNTPSVAAHCFNRKPITLESNAEFYKKNIVTGLYKQFIVERIEETSGLVTYPIAVVYLKDVDHTNKRCELCVFTSDDEEWNTESQATAIKILLEKAFDEYGMHKVYSYVFIKFADEVDLLRNAGFKEEAVLTNEAVDENGKFATVLRMATYSDNMCQ